MGRALDDVDRGLLAALSTDGRQTTRALARAVGLSDASVHERVRRLERDGVVRGYHAEVDPDAVGAGLAAVVAVRFGPGVLDRVGIDRALRAEPCVLEAHQVAGDDCYLVKVRVGCAAELADALDRVRSLPSVLDTRTTVVLRTVFERPLLAGAGD